MSKTRESSSLPSFQKLGHGVYLSAPDGKAVSTLQKRNGDPDLVILGSWMNAQHRNILKYTDYYQKLYPLSPILLLTSTSDDFFFNSDIKQRVRYGPAVSVVHDMLESTNSFERGVLVHSFSNGGTGQIAFLARQYYEKFGKPLPATKIIMDSAPGRARVKQGISSFSLGLPKLWLIRLPLQIFITIMIVLFYVIPHALGFPTLAGILRSILNSTEPYYLPKEAQRCYIYSDTDLQILAEDVELHAKEAEARGMDVVLEKFEGTQHVDHMRKYPDRYWAIVKRTWDGSL